MYPHDLDRFRATESRLNDRAKPVAKPRTRRSRDWFIKGPIPGEWLSRAAVLRGRAFHVAMAIRYLVGVEQSTVVTLTWRVLRKFGTSPDCGRRGLAALESAGLVSVLRKHGSCPRVTIQE